MTAAFGRVEAVTNMNIADYFPDGKSWAIRLHEKNDKVLTMPVHHRLEAFLDEYIKDAGGAESWPKDKQGYGQPLFRVQPA